MSTEKSREREERWSSPSSRPSPAPPPSPSSSSSSPPSMVTLPISSLHSSPFLLVHPAACLGGTNPILLVVWFWGRPGRRGFHAGLARGAAAGEGGREGLVFFLGFLWFASRWVVFFFFALSRFDLLRFWFSWLIAFQVVWITGASRGIGECGPCSAEFAMNLVLLLNLVYSWVITSTALDLCSTDWSFRLMHALLIDRVTIPQIQKGCIRQWNDTIHLSFLNLLIMIYDTPVICYLVGKQLCG